MQGVINEGYIAANLRSLKSVHRLVYSLSDLDRAKSKNGPHSCRKQACFATLFVQ